MLHDLSALQEKLYRTRFELHNTFALSIVDADNTICSPTTTAARIKEERDETAYVERNVLQQELQAKRNVQGQVIMTVVLLSEHHDRLAPRQPGCHSSWHHGVLDKSAAFISICACAFLFA